MTLGLRAAFAGDKGGVEIFCRLAAVAGLKDGFDGDCDERGFDLPEARVGAFGIALAPACLDTGTLEPPPLFCLARRAAAAVAAASARLIFALGFAGEEYWFRLEDPK